MALGNMTTEPRREITESLVGVAAGCALLYLDYLFALWFIAACNDPVFIGGGAIAVSMVLGAMVIVIAPILGIMLLYITHAMGEGTCTMLEAWGIQMRPRQRYTRLCNGKVVPRG